MQDNWTAHWEQFNQNTEPISENNKSNLKNYKYGTCKGPLPLEVPQWHFPPVNIDTSLMCEINKIDNPLILKHLPTSYIDIKDTDYNKVFTDSFKTPNGRVSATFCIPELNVEISKRLTHNISIVTG